MHALARVLIDYISAQQNQPQPQLQEQQPQLQAQEQEQEQTVQKVEESLYSTPKQTYPEASVESVVMAARKGHRFQLNATPPAKPKTSLVAKKKTTYQAPYLPLPPPIQHQGLALTDNQKCIQEHIRLIKRLEGEYDETGVANQPHVQNYCQPPPQNSIPMQRPWQNQFQPPPFQPPTQPQTGPKNPRRPFVPRLRNNRIRY